MPTPDRPPKRRWLAIFLILGALGLAAMAIPIIYNLSIQLRPEELAAARERWHREAPKDYDLSLLVKTTTPEAEREDAYRLQVRGGRPVSLGQNGSLLYIDPQLAVILGPEVLSLPSIDLRGYSIDALFAQMEKDLEDNVAAGGKNYTRAVFNPQDGHPSRYIHRVGRTRNQVDWFIRLDRTPAGRSGP
jgi:hypothetical protein